MGPHTFSASVPVQTGDLIGIDIPSTHGVTSFTSAPGSTWAAWDPATPKGSTSAPLDTHPTIELAFNATVQYPDPPGSGFTTTAKKAKCKKKKKRH